MLSIIKPRGDIKTNWEAANPILRMREWGIEWETTVGVGDVKIKIGDGVTPWSTLDYVLVNDVTKKIVKTFATVTAENPELTEGSSMDVLWATVKNKFEFLNQKVTDISENGDIDLTKVNLPSFTDYASDDTSMPDARTAINNITSSIKVPAFISNAKAALRGLVTLGEMRSLLVNSGLTTETGKYFLDAAYGKTLADQISQLNSQSQEMGNNIKNFRTYFLSVPGASGQEEKYTPSLNTLYNSMPDNQNFEIYLDVGSARRVSGMKANNNYGYMELKTYGSANNVVKKERILYNAVWSNWIEL